MKVIIAGSREGFTFGDVCAAMTSSKWKWECTEVVSGNARGVDRLGEQWAKAYKKSVSHFIAQWDTEGRAAGLIRNTRMADYADRLVALWDGKSKGTKHMIDTMLGLGKPVYVYRLQESA